MSWGIATCRTDGAPLVSTFHVPKAEFYCLDCGQSYGYMDPIATPATPDRVAQMEAYKAEFASFAEALMPPNAWRPDSCPKCVGFPPGGHVAHWTADEAAADAAAREALRARIRVPT